MSKRNSADADDYRDVLQPALQQALDRGEKVRIVLEFPSFDGIAERDDAVAWAAAG